VEEGHEWHSGHERATRSHVARSPLSLSKKAVATHHADHRVQNEEYDHPYYGEHDLDQRPV